MGTSLRGVPVDSTRSLRRAVTAVTKSHHNRRFSSNSRGTPTTEPGVVPARCGRKPTCPSTPGPPAALSTGPGQRRRPSPGGLRFGAWGGDGGAGGGRRAGIGRGGSGRGRRAGDGRRPVPPLRARGAARVRGRVMRDARARGRPSRGESPLYVDVNITGTMTSADEAAERLAPITISPRSSWTV